MVLPFVTSFFLSDSGGQKKGVRKFQQVSLDVFIPLILTTYDSQTTLESFDEKKYTAIVIFSPNDRCKL